MHERLSDILAATIFFVCILLAVGFKLDPSAVMIITLIWGLKVALDMAAIDNRIQTHLGRNILPCFVRYTGIDL